MSSSKRKVDIINTDTGKKPGLPEKGSEEWNKLANQAIEKSVEDELKGRTEVFDDIKAENEMLKEQLEALKSKGADEDDDSPKELFFEQLFNWHTNAVGVSFDSSLEMKGALRELGKSAKMTQHEILNEALIRYIPVKYRELGYETKGLVKFLRDSLEK